MANRLCVGNKVRLSNSQKGTIRYIGKTQFKAGIWIGIELDKIGSGKNDGSVYGVRYFVCPPNTGLFIQADRLSGTNETLLLKKRLSEIELENKQLKENNKTLKKTSIESLEILERLLESLKQENESIKYKLNLYLKDISALEYVLKSKESKEINLINLIKKERKLSSQLLLQTTNLHPIKESCALCNQLGHNLIDCQLI